MEDKKKFTYTYSSAENNEIRMIREKYSRADKNDSKIEQLKKLDKSVYNTATAVSLIVGTIGLLIFGLGLSCVLTLNDGMFIMGIVIGVIGIIILSLAYPAYMITENIKRKKIAPTIIKLADEIMKQ